MQWRCLFLFPLTLFVGLSHAQTPMLVLELSATTVTAGEQLNASCTAQSNTASRLLYANGESITNRISGNRLSSISSGKTTTWIIDPVLREDAGEYFCFSGGDQATHLNSLPQNVTVNSAVLLLEISATNITAGEQLAASCTALTITAIRVLYIDGASVVERISADRLSIVSSGKTTTWIIDPVEREDAGDYYCFAGGDQGTHLDSPPQNVTVYPSTDATVPTQTPVPATTPVLATNVTAGLPSASPVPSTTDSAGSLLTIVSVAVLVILATFSVVVLLLIILVALLSRR